MKKKLLPLFIIFSLFFLKAFPQDFLGLSTGNYSGVTGVMLQPASIVDSRHKFDINLFSTSVNYSNNYFLLDRNVILKFNKNNFDDYATFKDRYLTEGSLPAGEKVFFNINNRTQLPLSFMVTTGKKSAIAFNMQFRTIIQGRGINQDLAHTAFNNFYPENNPSIDASGININSLSWAEVGLTYGRVLYSSGKHFLKAAVTGKYLAGLSSISLSSDDLRMRVNGDSTFNFNSPNVSYNHNENADFNNLFDKNFSPNANSFGFDAGLVYEYRGNLDKFKYIKSGDETSHDVLRRDVSKYIFKLGVSLLDVGMFQFDKPADVNSFSANINNWDIKNAHYNSLKQFDTALAARVVANINDPRRYNVYLPSALSAQLDVKFVKGLFLNVMSYWPVSLGSDAGERFDKYGFYTITPRFETRHFGIYIPYTVTQRNSFTNYKQHLLGATVRLGPLFVGSSNLGSMLFTKNLRAADVHVGFKVGITYGKPNKSNQFINKIVKNNQEAEATSREYEENYSDSSSTKNVREEEKHNVKAKTNQNENPKLILDYKDGKVYDNPGIKQNVIIINNTYYYGNAAAQTRTDTVMVQNSIPKYYADSLNAQTQEIARQQNKKTADSISKITTDSLKMKRTQLDSLIKSMQQLQMQMDTTNQIDSINNRMNNSFKDGRSSNNPSAMENLKATDDNSQITDTTINRMDTNQKDAATAFSNNQTDTFLTVKKKDNPVTQNKNDTTLGSVGGDTTAVARMQTVQRDSSTQDLQHKKQEQNELTVKDEIQSDSLLKANIVAQEKNNKAALAAKQDYTIATARSQRSQMQSNTQDLQSIRDHQDKLYRQYADQSARLESDISRLSERLSSSRQHEEGGRDRYIPLPIPINNSRSERQDHVAAAPSVRRDTVYIRDTVTVLKKDTTRNIQRDTIKLTPPATTKRTIIKEKNPDTVVIKKSIAQPGFDYTALPEQIILFGVSKSAVQPIYDSHLNFIADVLKKNSDLQVIVTGHTDATGSKAINEKLSLKRAEAVFYYLLNKGISKKQINVKSLSSEKPAVAGSTEAARSQNRRVSLKLTKLEE